MLIFEFISLFLKTKNDIEYEYKINNKNFEKTTDVSLKDFVKYMLFEMEILYFYDTNNNYFQPDEFRKPTVGKDYKNEDIIIAGCSFAQGACLNDDETISAVIAKKFPKYKVYNIGLCGGSQRETLYILRNSQKYKDWNILPRENEDTKFFIFIHFKDQKRRLILTSLRTDSPHFKVKKSKNGEQKLDFYIPKNNIRKTFTYKNLTENLNFSDSILKKLNGLLFLYYKEIQKEIATKYPNAKFVIYDYQNNLEENDIKNLENGGIKVIGSDKDYRRNPYLAFDNSHPNGRAWEEITDYLGKKLNF